MKLKAIYQPKGRALEYAKYALNLSLGCTHGCKYCYVPAVLKKSREEFHAAAPPRAGILEKLEHDLAILRDEGVRDQVLMCFTTDPYCTPEIAAVTRLAMKLFVQYGIPFTILTKGGFADRSGYVPMRDFDLYRPCDAFGTTLTFENSVSSLEYEPGAAVGLTRTEHLRIAHDRYGIYTWVSFEPVLDEEQVVDLFYETKDFVDLYKIGKTNYGYPCNVKSWGAFGRVMEVLCKEHGKAYYIKKDLRLEMERG